MKSMKFNEQSTQAILEGRKIMTRRPIKPQPIQEDSGYFTWLSDYGLHVQSSWDNLFKEITEESKYKVGETVQIVTPQISTTLMGLKIESKTSVFTENIFLKITNIKAEYLQDISEDDCIKEGVTYGQSMLFVDKGEGSYKRAFEEEIWNKLPYQAPYDWNSNPYVFVYEFEVVA